MTKFLRRTWSRYSKLGKGRRKKQRWRKPKGRDNKMREKRKGYPAVVSIGYRKSPSERKEIRVIFNVKDLDGVSKGDTVVLGKLGKKKKVEVLKKALEKGIQIQNLNAKKFINEFEKNAGRESQTKKTEKAMKEKNEPK